MPIRTDFKPGEFCWHDLVAHDYDIAIDFYGGLFGWTPVVQDTKGGPPYAFFLAGAAAAAAVGQMDDAMKAQGIPPMWNSYVSVEDCAASEQKAKDLGATITVPTTEVPGHGKLSYFLDPHGASIAMWQQTGEPQGIHLREPGGVAWNELVCRDVAAAREFYGAMFGWGFRDMPMGPMQYTMIEVDGEDAGGMMAMDGPQFEADPNHWAVYFAVADCDGAAAKIESLGGKIMVPPTEIPVGKFSVAQDAQGGTFSIVQNAATC